MTRLRNRTRDSRISVGKVTEKAKARKMIWSGEVVLA
jgi:hypothetical protein